MAFELPFQVKVVNPLPVDYYYLDGSVPYASVAQALLAIDSAVRYRGMTINVDGKEYWFRDGTGDGDIKLKRTDEYYLHTQSTPSTTWNVAHFLDKDPAVHVEDGSGNEVKAQITYIDSDNLQITFAIAQTGTAHCS